MRVESSSLTFAGTDERAEGGPRVLCLIFCYKPSWQLQVLPPASKQLPSNNLNNLQAWFERGILTFGDLAQEPDGFRRTGSGAMATAPYSCPTNSPTSGYLSIPLWEEESGNGPRRPRSTCTRGLGGPGALEWYGGPAWARPLGHCPFGCGIEQDRPLSLGTE